MCGQSVSYSSPEVNEVNTERSAAPSTTTLKQSRRINPNELAQQVANYINAKGEVVSHQGGGYDPFSTASMSKSLKIGSLRASFEASRSPENPVGTAHVVVKKGKKVLLEANGDSTFNFTDATYTPGSWTKPFRSASARQAVADLQAREELENLGV